jgi:flagellar protein FliO/FliZ
MDLANFARAVFALAITIGLIGLAGVALRRFGPEAMARLAPAHAARRLAVVETLVLDPTRRLVIVACDGQERLLLLGEGQVLDAAPALPQAPSSAPLNASPPAPRKARKPKAAA